MKLVIELPVLNKFLLCLPLRSGLIAWGCAQLVAVLVISWYAIIDFAEVYHYDYYDKLQSVIIFIITLIVSVLEIINCILLLLGAHKKNANFLEVCYHFLKVKIPVLIMLLIIMFFLNEYVYSQIPYHYCNLDPWRCLIFLDNPAMGMIDIGLQFYLLLLVRSEIIKLEHPIGITSLYQRLFDKPIPADALTSKPYALHYI